VSTLCALGHTLHSRTQCKTISGRKCAFNHICDLGVVFSKEQVRLFNLKDLCVSNALLRLKQASPNQQHPQQALLIKVQTRYIALSLSMPIAKHSWAKNSKGSRWNASRKPIGVLREFLRSQFTSER
jgi:hypothetical protein